MKKTILITGASGFVGTYLTRILLEQGHDVIGLGTSAAHPTLSGQIGRAHV